MEKNGKNKHVPQKEKDQKQTGEACARYVNNKGKKVKRIGKYLFTPD